MIGFCLESVQRLETEVSTAFEVVAEGDEPSLQILLSALQRGPYGARVDYVESVFSAATGEFTGFSIRS